MPRNVDYFCSDTIREDLKGKTVRGGVYTALAQLGGIVIQLGSLSILAKLLTKEDFGLVAMALVFTGFASMFVDAGMSMATVQRDRITHGQVSNLFWLSSGLGLLMSLVTAAFAPAIAWFYNRPDLTPVVIALAVPFLFAGMTSQHRALLTRSMCFKKLAAVSVGAQFLSRALAVALAWWWRNYWALAVAHAALPLLTMVFTWWAARWAPSLPSRSTGVKGMVAFGANLTGFSTINFFTRNTDNLLIGKFWGEAELGVYDQAYKLFLMPMRKINGPIAAVAVPALSRLKSEGEKYRQCYLGIVGKLVLVTVPTAAFLSFNSEAVVAGVLSRDWMEAAPILRILAVVGLFQAVGNTLSWLYISQGRSRELFRFGMFAAVCTVVSFIVGLPWGALGVACGYAAFIILVGFPANVYFATRGSSVSWRDVLLLFKRPAPAVLGVVIGAGVCRALPLGQEPVLQLMATASVAGALVAAGVLAVPATRRDVVSLVSALRGRTLYRGSL